MKESFVPVEIIQSSRCQIGALKRGKNIKYLPCVFTQEGVAMLSIETPEKLPKPKAPIG